MPSDNREIDDKEKMFLDIAKRIPHAPLTQEEVNQLSSDVAKGIIPIETREAMLGEIEAEVGPAPTKYVSEEELNRTFSMNKGYYSRGGRLLWVDIEYAVEQMAKTLEAHKSVPEVIVAVGRGGMIPATLLSHKLEVEDVGFIDSYHTDGGEIYVGPSNLTIKVLDNARILFIDDIWDSGATHAALQKKFPEATFATLYYKERASEAHAHQIVSFPGLPVKEGEWVYFPWESPDE